MNKCQKFQLDNYLIFGIFFYFLRWRVRITLFERTPKIGDLFLSALMQIWIEKCKK